MAMPADLSHASAPHMLPELSSFHGLPAVWQGWGCNIDSPASTAQLIQISPRFLAISGLMMQILEPLQPAEVITVACMPAVAEELLFRGGLIPAVTPDWYAQFSLSEH